MNKVNIVALSPSDIDNRRSLAAFYRKAHDADGQLPMICEENIDLDIYSEVWLRGVQGDGPIFATDLKMSSKKSSFEIGWTMVTLGTPPDSEKLAEAMGICDFLVISVSCRAFLESGDLPSQLKKVTALMNTAPKVPVRFIFLDSGAVDSDTRQEILSKFGFTDRYHTRGTAFTCAEDPSDFAEDLIADAIGVLHVKKSASLNLMRIKKKLTKS